MEKLVDMLNALSDETRLRILNLLYERELCVCDIMGTLQITQAKASRHLIYMKNAGLYEEIGNVMQHKRVFVFFPFFKTGSWDRS